MRMGSLICRQMIKCLGDREAGWKMVTWMGGWWQVKAILVARNINLTVTRRGVGSSCEATTYNLADLADPQASWRSVLARQRWRLFSHLWRSSVCAPPSPSPHRSPCALPLSWPSFPPHGPAAVLAVTLAPSFHTFLSSTDLSVCSHLDNGNSLGRKQSYYLRKAHCPVGRDSASYVCMSHGSSCM